jgi:4-hydroxy-tetrahydrodipicolinate synthase
MKNPGRLVTAMVTPFDDRGELSAERTKVLVRHLLKTGTECILVCGTTGESPALTDDEKLKLLSWVRESVPAGYPVMFGAGTNCTAKSIELGIKAKDNGADILLLVVPYYNKPPQEGIFRHFSEIANTVKLPSILYNVPSRTGINMDTDTVRRLSQNKYIIGIKEASGSLDTCSVIRVYTDEKFLIYSGDDSLTLPILSVGGAGVISVASHVAGKRIGKMMEAHFKGDVDKARKIHIELMPLFKGLFFTTNPIPVKEALNQMGIKVGGVRPPLIGCNKAGVDTISVLLNQYRLGR